MKNTGRVAAASALASAAIPHVHAAENNTIQLALVGVYSDYYIHQIDECSWMKGAWPVEAHAVGGRHYRGESVDQNFDTYSVEYTFPDGRYPIPMPGLNTRREF